MPRTTEEIVKWKYNSLKRKVQHARHRVDELDQRVKSSLTDFNSLNVTLDNMLFFLDDFISSFDDVCPALEPSNESNSGRDVSQKMLSSCSASKQESMTDPNGAVSDVATKMEILHREVNELKAVIHGGGGDGEASSQRGILTHMAHLENSFNEGKQKIISSEQKLQDIDVRHVCLVNEVGNKATVSDYETCKKRLAHVEDQLKAVQPVLGAKGNEETQVVKAELGVLRFGIEEFKTEVLQRISQLEDRPAVVFGVTFKHDGPWNGGVVVRDVKSLEFNYGNGFQEDQGLFLAPVSGIYCFTLYTSTEGLGGESRVLLWLYDTLGNDWKHVICSVSVNKTNFNGCDVALVQLNKGEVVRLRVYDGCPFIECSLHGWLVLPVV